MKVKRESEVAQSCPTPSDPMDCSLLGSSIHGTFQARVLEWGAIAFSMTNLDSILKSRDITLPMKVLLVKAMVFHILGNWSKFMNSAEKAMSPHSSTLAWKIPWTEEPGRLQSMGSLGVRHD